MRGITRDCFAEMRDRKFTYILGVVTLFVVVAIIYSGSIEFNMGGADMELGDLTSQMGPEILGFFSSFLNFLVFLTVMGTAGLVPKMFIKGRADYFISKPISRTSLILNKLLGIWIAYGSVIFVCGLIAYLAVEISHGGVGFSIAWLFGFHLINFLIWLTITVFVGLASGSQAFSIMAAFLVWVLHSVVASARSLQEFLGSRLLANLIDVTYFVVPKNSEFVDVGLRLSQDRMVLDWLPFYTTLMFGLLMVVATVYIFRRKNY